MGLPSLADIFSGLTDSAMDLVNNANPALRSGLEAHGAVTGIDTLGWAHDRSIQQAGDDRRSDLYSERARESLGFGGGYEPPAVQMENFEALSHEQMKAAVESTNPGSMLDDARAWRNAAEQIKASVTAFNEAIRGAIEGGWEGKGAESARATVARYATQSQQLEHAARLVANKIEEAHTGIDQARQRMPEPERGGVLDVLRGAAMLNPVGGLMAAFHKSEAVRQQAVQIMTTEYAPVVLQADSQVPILPVPRGPSGGGVDVDHVGMGGSGSHSTPAGLGNTGASGANGSATPYGATYPTQFGSGASSSDPSGAT
ncbi:MAG TPA: PPE domain-containing protein, partial [Aldersonia sp.]